VRGAAPTAPAPEAEDTRMRGTWKTITLGLAGVLLAASAHAEEPRWRPTTSQVATASPPPTAPAVQLGRPVPLSEAEGPPPPAPVRAHLQPVAYSFPPPAPGPRFVRAQAPDVNFQRNDGPLPAVPTVAPPNIPPPPPPPPPAPAGPGEGYLCSQVTSNSGPGVFERGREVAQGVGGFFTPVQQHGIFQSDSCFPWMISPVSEPFFALDPRALTEVRPIFIYQQTPHANGDFHGGNVGFFGLQARASLAQRVSLVIEKLGWVWIDPRHPDDAEFHRTSGFAELWLGPQVTIIRNPESRTLLAAGVTFQIPTGSSRVFQNTGNLTVAPYISFAQNFGHCEGVGSFNFLNTTGYAIGADSKRTDYFYTQFHLDYDVCDWHKFFPLIELNWVHYTQNGGARDLNFEGKDLFNFGAEHVAGHGVLSLAFGARYKFCEAIQVGGAIEFPIFREHTNLDAFRVTIDMIFRY
jgi:hypothetical protein